MARRKISISDGVAATRDALRDIDSGTEPAQRTLATAVRFLLEELADTHRGKTVEVRVPPFGAVQCGDGPSHTRGTPPNVVETDPVTWLQLATGRTTWEDAVSVHMVTASGSRATLAQFLPVITDLGR